MAGQPKELGSGVRSIEDAINYYYAKNCRNCGKEMVLQPDGEHEDEWLRGYCRECSAKLAAQLIEDSKAR